jgi:hypothetical protein
LNAATLPQVPWRGCKARLEHEGHRAFEPEDVAEKAACTLREDRPIGAELEFERYSSDHPDPEMDQFRATASARADRHVRISQPDDVEQQWHGEHGAATADQAERESDPSAGKYGEQILGCRTQRGWRPRS